MAYFIYTLLCLIWGSTWLAIKIGLDDASPFWSAAWRFIIAALLMIAINHFRGEKYPRDRREILRIAFPGLFLYGASYLLVYWAEVYIDSALTAVIYASMPFFVAALGVMMIPEEKLSRVGWLGLVIGFAGILLVFRESLGRTHFILFGTIISGLASLGSAYGSVYIRKYLRQYSISMMASLQMTLGALMLLLTALLFEPFDQFKITGKSVFSLLYLIIFGTVVAFSGYYWLLKRIKVVTVSLIAFITPILAILLGVFFRQETFTWPVALGTILILGGILLVIKK